MNGSKNFEAVVEGERGAAVDPRLDAAAPPATRRGSRGA